MEGPYSEGVREVFVQLARLAHALSEGDYSRVDELFHMTQAGRFPPEVTELAEAFGMMAVKVEAREYSLEEKNAALRQKNEELAEALRQLELQTRMKEVMARFVPQTVQARIEANPSEPGLERRERDVTVMFLDVGNYTGLSARLDPSGTSELIEAYFSSFVDRIHEGGGDINETAGDGLMVIFQDEDAWRHACEAVGVALRVRECVARLNADRAALHPPVAINIGINSGVALVGSTRIRGTGSDRWTYTASGMVTNVAARLCKLASAGAILVSSETARRIAGSYRLVGLGPHQLKNVEEPVPVFQVSETGDGRPGGWFA